MNKKWKWSSCALEAVASLVSGRTPEREQKEYYAKEGTPWVKIENLNQGVITKTAEYLSEKGRAKVNLVPAGSVLFSIVGTVGKVGIAGREAAMNQQIVALIFDENRVLGKYGYYYMRYHAANIKQLANQTTMALISRKTLAQYRISFPEDLEKQKEIVENLEKFEALVWKKEAWKMKMGEYEKIFFHRIFHKELRYHEKLPLKEYIVKPITSGIPQEEKSGQMPKREIFLRNGRVFLEVGEKKAADIRCEQEYTYFQERGVLRIHPEEKKLLPEVLHGYLQQDCMADVLYGERKAGENRKRPIRASELEEMRIPYFTMKKQQEYAVGWRKIRKIQQQLEQERALAHKIYRLALRKLLEEPCMEKAEQEAEASEKETQEKSLEELLWRVLIEWQPMDLRLRTEYEQRRDELLQGAAQNEKGIAREALLLLLKYMDGNDDAL